ncbi:FtsQ-type POTRA domain-containing protein [Chloroflexales bacterium ZM16-3]|nr:FtsQ-type POTRA domain-containing protein [Chloroflexales bacterium ZM16-3]
MDYNPPNTRQRIAARRLARQGRPADGGSQVRPDARRSTLAWLASGRLVSLLIFLASMGTLGYLLTSGRYSIQQVTVAGASALKPNQVIAESGISGRPIWFVDAAQTAARLRANPYVESAQVELALPDRAIITVIERRPEVRWQAGSVQYLVDGRGQVLAAAQEPATTDVLVVIDRTTPELKPGDQIDPDALILTRALALRLPGEAAFTPAQIGWDFGIGVYVRSQTGQTIIFGQSKDLDRKLAIFRELLKDQTPFTYLDLRPSNPFYQNGQQAAASDQP